MVSAAQVCSRWRDMIYAPELWKDVPARLNLDSMTSLDFDSLRIRKMRKAVVSCREIGKMKDFVASVSSSLESLDVTRRRMTREEFSEIFQVDFPCLRKVSVRVWCVRSRVLELFSMHMRNFTHLYLETYVSRETISSLNGLTKLTHLELMSESYLTLPVPAQLPTQSSCMEEIIFAFMDVDDSGLSYIRQVHGKLKRLEITLAQNVSVSGIQKLADMPALESLQLVSNHPVDGWMEYLSRGLSQLTGLDLLRCPILSKIEFLAKLPALEKLMMRVDCDTDSWKCLSQCVKLKVLVLSLGTSMAIDVQSLTALGCLEALHLSHCSMQDADLHTICQSLPFLKIMSLGSLPRITDEVMGAVCQMPHLERLFLQDCNVGDESMRYLSAGIAPLHTLFLDGVKVTDQGLKNLCEGLRHARTVGITKCPISESGLGFVVRNLPCLETLHTSMSTRAVQRLRLLRPKLMITVEPR